MKLSLHAHLQDFYNDADMGSENSDDESDEDPQEEVDNHPQAEFEAFASRSPREDFAPMDFLDNLGTRDVDLRYDWFSHVGRYDISRKFRLDQG